MNFKVSWKVVQRLVKTIAGYTLLKVLLWLILEIYLKLKETLRRILKNYKSNDKPKIREVDYE